MLSTIDVNKSVFKIPVSLNYSPDPLHQNLWGWDPGIGIFKSQILKLNYPNVCFRLQLSDVIRDNTDGVYTLSIWGNIAIGNRVR